MKSVASISILFIIFSFSNLKAQVCDSALFAKVYKEKTIYIQGNQRYSKSGKVYRIGNNGKFLKEEFAEYPNALMEIAQFRKLNNVGGLMCGASSALAVFGLVSTLAPPMVILVVGAGTVLYFVGVTYIQDAHGHLYRSIWVYNKEVLKRHLVK